LAKPESPRRKADLAFEFSVGDFETMNETATRDCAGAAETDYRNPVGINRHFHVVAVDAGKRDGYHDLGIGLDDIDRRFPAQLGNRCGRRLEDLTMLSFGAIDHLASRSPH
jgi:hypothetical protein